jgi:hypothetical protein
VWFVIIDCLLCYIIQMIHFKLFDSRQYTFIICSLVKTCFLPLVSNCSFVKKHPQYQELRSFHKAATMTLVWQVLKFFSFTTSRKIGSHSDILLIQLCRKERNHLHTQQNSQWLCMQLSPETLQFWSEAVYCYDLSSTFSFGFANICNLFIKLNQHVFMSGHIISRAS